MEWNLDRKSKNANYYGPQFETRICFCFLVPVGMILVVVLVAVAQDFGFAQPAWDLVYQGNMSNKCSCFFDILLSTVLNQRLDHHLVSFFVFPNHPTSKLSSLAIADYSKAPS